MNSDASTKALMFLNAFPFRGNSYSRELLSGAVLRGWKFCFTE